MPINRVHAWSKRATALILAGTVAASSAMGSLAPAAYAAPGQGSVTITSAQGAQTKYDVYRFFKAEVSDDNKASHVDWAITPEKQTKLIEHLGQDYVDWLDNKGMSADAVKLAQNALEYISQNIATSTGKTGEDPKWVDASTFAMNLATWAKGNLTPAAEKAVAGQVYTAEEGYYLFLTDPATLGTSALATLPIWLPLGGSTATVEEKAASVTVAKQVKEDASWQAYADAEIGEAVQFRIQAKTPANYNGFSSFKVAFADAMPAGMTLDKDSVKVFVGDEGGVDVTGSFTNGSTEQNLSVSRDNTKNIAQIAPDSTITVTYTASLNASATTGKGDAGTVAGNASATTFTYSNDPQVATTEGTATSELVELYTYQASLDKMDKVTDVPLAGAEFVIKNDTDRYLSADGTWTADDKNAQVFTTNDQGAISGIKGLDAGTYTIVETKAPEGYSLPANTSISLTVAPEYDASGALTGLTCETKSDFAVPGDAADPATGMVNLDVKNDKQFSLAVTGAAGVGMGGAVVLAIGLGWYVARAHRKNAEQ